jgi:hypothetical protein
MNITSPPWRYPGAPKERDEADSMLSIQQQTSMQSVTSPTRPSLEDKEDEINRLANAEEGTTDSLDDTNIDVENLGMTSERQKEIQGSLFRMLGHENDGGDGSDD